MKQLNAFTYIRQAGTLAATLALSGVLAVTASAATAYPVGDLNLDGEATAADLTTLSRHVAGIELSQTEGYLLSDEGEVFSLCDIDLSGAQNAADLTKLSRHVAGVEELSTTATAYAGRYVGEPSEGLDYSLNEEGTGYIVVSIGDCTDKDIVISSTVNDLPVLAVGDEAFYETNITSVVIPEGVTAIGERAFQYCEALADVTLPETLEEVGDGVFSNCESLTDIDLPDGLTHIGENAFSKSALTTVSLPDSVEEIGEWAFATTGITEIAIPEGVSQLKACVFWCCDALNKAYLPGTLEVIENQAFYACSGLTEIVYNGTVEEWLALEKGEYWDEETPVFKITCLDGTVNNVVYDEKGLQYRLNPGRGSYTLSGKGSCTDTDIVIPATVDGLPVTAIGMDALSMEDITSVVVPEGVTSIGEDAFWFCEVLSKVYLPGTLEVIEKQAFYACSLTEIVFNGTVDEWLSVEKEEGWDAETSTYKITCLDGTLDNETSDGMGLLYSLNGDGGYTLTGVGTCTDLDIVIPSTYNGLPVTAIGYQAFSGADLFSVVIPEGVTSIGEDAFYNCNDLESITIPTSVRDIGAGAFATASMTEITIPEGVLCLESDVFWGCNKLETIYLPGTLETIKTNAFFDCDSLKKIVFNGTLEEWEAVTKEEDWDDDSAAYTVVCLDGTISVAVYDENGLAYRINREGTAYSLVDIGLCGTTDVVVSSEINGLPVTVIWLDALSDCYWMESLVIPEGVKEIDWWACSYNESLTTVTLPSTLWALPYCSFYGCEALTTINYNGTVEEWNLVTKYGDWNKYTGEYTVYCTDGTVEKEVVEW